jgi:hypothetical protein
MGAAKRDRSTGTPALLTHEVRSGATRGRRAFTDRLTDVHILVLDDGLARLDTLRGLKVIVM